ncbi:MAG: efflux RND transporter periplasmic adaptor subunit [Thioalkalivibrionaceae bacterium]
MLVFASSAWADLPFATQTIERVSIAGERMLDGRVAAVQRSTVSAQTSGRITEVSFDVDDFVEQGQLVVRISSSEQTARVSQAEGNLADARSRLAEARSEFERIEAVFAQNVVSRAEFDRAQAALNSARARFQSAQAALEEARQQLDYTEVRAPYSGIVTERHIEVGESVSPGSPLLSGLSLDALRVELDVPSRLVARVREQGSARVITDSGVSLESNDVTVFPYADERSNTFRVRVELPEGATEAALFPGMFVKVALKVDERDRLIVPADAVAFRSEVAAVYVVDDNDHVRMRQLRLGSEVEGGFEVLAGLHQGERIALDPVRAAIHLKEQSAR